ncbi:type II CAAX prenyl endopeptidase Rce1 family protein [Hyperthermus butylicus]|uniref:CAAX prenyl protease 2/Lysostaphin resistance protein A-like domain-containing protein n=1 Tax=Hyperthermus butylicus (strain DSM 5456 / JCM 9403 / PLM1-5) TaxID=415426 RepID=A2BMF2_HYPBU|nr:CPBP family glutamic-type intramembrane protease [Hyperthermus butylicus]ABM81163.1 hypothetical protein Hbut_1334 [Hyperthermus butylicus DSM 5456]
MAGFELTTYRRVWMVVYVFLPWILWPLAFVVFREHFLIAMVAATGVLGLATATIGPGVRLGGIGVREAVCSVAYAVLLYALFVAGGVLSKLLGLWEGVAAVYGMVGRGLHLVPALAWIGFLEEVYWRGGFQEGLLSRATRRPWLASSLVYSAVHVFTGNLVLVAAALVVGLVLGFEAHRCGVAASSLTHVLWLYAVILVAPVNLLLG